MARNTTTRDRIRAALARTGAGCWICGHPIDYTLRWVEGQHGPRCHDDTCTGCVPDPMRFEADHVVPLKRGGADTLENSRASHRQCNNRKRARLVAPIVRQSRSVEWPT